MKNSVFILGLFTTVLLSCSKEVNRKDCLSEKQYSNSIIPHKDNEIETKSTTRPEFDFNNPVVTQVESSNSTITSYFETGYEQGQRDFWMLHDFNLEGTVVSFVYHNYEEDNATYSDVYDWSNNHLFTYKNEDGVLSIIDADASNPEEFNDDFTGCLKWHLVYGGGEWTLIYGTPYVAYWTYKCYKKYGQSR